MHAFLQRWFVKFMYTNVPYHEDIEAIKVTLKKTLATTILHH